MDADPASRTPPVTSETALRELILRGVSGDERAYAVFLEQVAARLRPYFRRRLFEGQDEAEDLVQEVLIAIHIKRSTFDPAQPVTAWVYAIARYKLADHLRRLRRRGVQLPVEDVGDLFSDFDAEAGVARADLERLLDQLPVKQRESIRMVKIEDRSIREAAERASMSESDVKVSIHRGIKALSRMIRGKS